MNDGITDIGDSAAISHLSAADMSDRKGNSSGDLIPKKQVCYSSSNFLHEIDFSGSFFVLKPGIK